MRRWTSRALGTAVVSLSLAHVAGADGVVIISEGADMAPATLRTVRFLAEQELRDQGIRVVAAPELDGVVVVEPALGTAVARLGATQLFVVHLGRLDEKVLVGLEELEAPGLQPVFSSTLTASSIDEAERVLERLAVSVVERVPVADTARIDTLTDVEGEKHRKKPGEHLFVFGLNLAPIGGSLGWSYEADHWRLGALFHGADKQLNYIGIDGAYLFGDGDVSPYVGVGLGVVGEEDDYLGTKLEVGVEALRLHGVRLMAGAYAVIGLEDHVGEEQFSPGIFLRLGF